jgi:hypothetical protein
MNYVLLLMLHVVREADFSTATVVFDYLSVVLFQNLLREESFQVGKKKPACGQYAATKKQPCAVTTRLLKKTAACGQYAATTRPDVHTVVNRLSLGS